MKAKVCVNFQKTKFPVLKRLFSNLRTAKKNTFLPVSEDLPG